MSQIMRLRRIAGSDHGITDNNGHRHEEAFVVLLKKYGILAEGDVVPRSYGGNGITGGKLSLASNKEIVSSLPFLGKALLRGKLKIKDVLIPHRLAPADRAEVRAIYDTVNAREKRLELNLYITGYDEDGDPVTEPATEKEGATA